MSRPKKDGVILNIMLEAKANKLLEKYCEDTGATKTKTVEKAIEFFVENYYNLHHKENIKNN